MTLIRIGDRAIGGNEPCYIIAEVAQAHDGSLGIAHSYIDAVASTGVDAIKFQTHIADAESTKEEKFRVNFSYEDSSRYEYWKRMEFSEKQWKELKAHCDDVGIEFLSSPFSVEAVELLDRIGMRAWKVGSGEVNNPLTLQAMIETSKPILLSTGMSGWEEIGKAVNSVLEAGLGVALFQCTSKYPTTLQDVGLNIMDEIRARYSVPVGLSDHSGLVYPPFAAIARGVDMLEVHVVFSKKMFGPDTVSSLTLERLTEVVGMRDAVIEMYAHPVNKDEIADQLKSMKKLFNKSIVIVRDLQKGAVLTHRDLTVKKPGTGIPADQLEKCLGKVLQNNVSAGQLLEWNSLGEVGG
jgi:N,N'-diacetyllegionaminate synthase